MKLEVGLAISNVPPMTFIYHHAANRVAAPDRFEKMRNDRTFHAAFEKIDKFWTYNVNAAEYKFLRRPGTELISNVDDAPGLGIESDVFRSRA